MLMLPPLPCLAACHKLVLLPPVEKNILSFCWLVKAVTACLLACCMATAVGTACHHYTTMLLPLPLPANIACHKFLLCYCSCYNYSCIVASDAAVPLLFTIAAANRLLLYFPFFDMAGALTASCAIFTAVAAPTAVTCCHHWLIVKL